MEALRHETPLKDIPFVAFDFETTGMDPLQDKIIEIGMALFRNGEILETFQQMVNPGIPIPKEAVKVHGITDEMLFDKPQIQEFLPGVVSLFSKGVPMAHNTSFDFAFLAESARREGLALPISPMVDTCRLAKGLFPALPTHRLTFLVQHFGIQAEQSHRALADAQSCFKVFCKSVEKFPLQWDTPWGELQSRISGILYSTGHEPELPENLSPIRTALEQHQRLKLSYRDGKGDITQRELTPVGFSYDGRRTVLIAYCHLRQSTRTFRLDRILEVL